MKRFHVHAHVENLDASIAFYSKMFASVPTRVESDYAKWMLDDPRINFAISTRGSKTGVDHLGIQTDTEEELVALREQAEAADLTLQDVGETTCCYARSDKYWVTDPQGIAWEQFHTLGNIPVFNEKKTEPASACCATPPKPRRWPSPSRPIPSLPAAEACRGPKAFQCALRLHWQLSAFHPGRGLVERDQPGSIQGLLCRQPSQGHGASDGTARAAGTARSD